MARFQPNDGIAPQMAVPMNISADSRIAERRPKRSATRPHTTEPTVVPVSANSASTLAPELSMPYSARMPGITKPSVAGFMTSIASVTTSTVTSVQCARLSGTPSATWKLSGAPMRGCTPVGRRGSMPQADSASPIGMIAMPTHWTAQIFIDTHRPLCA